MAFSDVGCGTNACWFQCLVWYRIICCSFTFGGLVSKRMASLSGRAEPAGPIQIFCDLVTMCLIGLNLYFLKIALKASKSEKCEHHLWKRWSMYTKIMMIIVGIGGACIVLLVATFDPRDLDGTSPIAASMGILIIVSVVLVGEGLMLLITKNRYEEKIREEAERREGDSEYLKPV